MGTDKGGQVRKDQDKFAVGHIASLKSLVVNRCEPVGKRSHWMFFENTVMKSDAFSKIRSVVGFIATVFHYAP